MNHDSREGGTKSTTLYLKVPIWSNRAELTPVLHARLYGIFIKIRYDFGRQEINSTNQGYNFLKSSFSNRVNVRIQSNLEVKEIPPT